MRIAFAGTPEVAIPALWTLLDAGHEVVAVITRPDAPAGRGRALQPSAVASFAEERGLKVLKPLKLADIRDELAALAPECVAVVAYGGLVPTSMLDLPQYGWINLHFSLLPEWRGAAPVQWAILSGDDLTGACTFRIEEGLDTGPVFGSLTRPIAPADTSGSLLAALAADGARLLAQTIGALDRLHPVPQARDGVSVAPKLGKADARIRWHEPALAVDRRIRACTPEPGAWSMLADQRIGVEPVVLRPDVIDLAPGVVRSEGKAVLVGTGSHAVALQRVKPAGKAWMDAGAWMRGLRGNVEFTDADR
jgi:methionyl-tRNA formyltransferase